MEHIKEKVISLIDGLGYHPVEVHIAKQRKSLTVRAVIYRNEGIGLNDCSQVHQVVQPQVEVLAPGESVFVEITSPGTDRVFKNREEYPLFVGRMIKVLLQGKSDWLMGKLISADNDKILLEEKGEEMEIKMEKITKGKLDGIRESANL